jgi:hypothetical protein
MRGLIASFSANVCVAVTVVALTVSAHGQAAEGIPGAKQMDGNAMQEVCESSAAVNVDHEGRFQCDVCPSYTDFHGTRQGYGLQQAFEGHFSTTDTEQLLLVMWGCEPHASGFGGSVLLTRDGKVWKKSAYFQAEKPFKCYSFKAHDGFDLLVCRGGDAHQGDAEYWINAQSYKGASVHKEPLLNTSSNLAGGSPQAGYCYDQEIDSFERLSSGAGFGVVVRQVRGLAPPGEKSCGETEIPMEPEQTVHLNFLFDGDHFALAQGSEDSLGKVENFVPHP